MSAVDTAEQQLDTSSVQREQGAHWTSARRSREESHDVPRPVQKRPSSVEAEDLGSVGKQKEGQPQPWRRILWARQPYPDNYVSPDFLSSLRSGTQDGFPTFAALVNGSLPLTQRLCITLAFVGLFLHLQGSLITTEALATSSIVGICACGATMPTSRVIDVDHLDAGMEPHTSQARAPSSAASVPRRSSQPMSYALLGLFILAVSPLLKTLTESTTSDSIAALSTTLFVISFALADFSTAGLVNTHISRAFRAQHGDKGAVSECRCGSEAAGHQPKRSKQTPLPATLSLNAALCASTVLASRLDSPFGVFALVLSAIFLFGFLPRWIKHYVTGNPDRGRGQSSLVDASRLLSVLTTLMLLAASVVLLARFSHAAAVANVLVAVFLSIACPAWMRRAQRWKLSRRGPWDVSVPRLRSSH